LDSPPDSGKILPVSELFLPFRSPAPKPTTHVRSTILVSGIQTLRDHGVYQRYLDVISPELRESIVSLIAGAWVPIDLAVEHYRAADGLGLDPLAIEAIGREVADRTYKSVLAPIFEQSKQEGTTPWSLFGLAHRNNDINWKGGDIRIFKEGTKEAIYEWVGQPCAAVPYFVKSFGAVMRALVNLFCARAYCRVLTERCSPTAVCLRLTWV